MVILEFGERELVVLIIGAFHGWAEAVVIVQVTFLHSRLNDAAILGLYPDDRFTSLQGSSLIYESYNLHFHDIKKPFEVIHIPYKGQVWEVHRIIMFLNCPFPTNMSRSQEREASDQASVANHHYSLNVKTLIGLLKCLRTSILLFSLESSRDRTNQPR